MTGSTADYVGFQETLSKITSGKAAIVIGRYTDYADNHRDQKDSLLSHTVFA